MAKTQRIYLVGALICSLISTALLVVSLATENWVTSEPVWIFKPDSQASSVNYGLFFGNLNKTDLLNASNTYPLTMTCLISDNVCAWSCLSSEVDRVKEVKNLYEGKNVTFLCKPTDTRNIQSSLSYVQNKEGKANGGSDGLINAGMWVSTIAFLAIALLFSVIGCGFTVLNIFTNPIDLYASVFGLYIWFGIAAAADLLALIIWGAEFGVQLSSNIAILDTIIPKRLTSDGLASLGYSYFLIIPAEIVHLAAIGLIFYRDFVINRESKQKTIAVNTQADNNDLIY